MGSWGPAEAKQEQLQLGPKAQDNQSIADRGIGGAAVWTATSMSSV